jgi:hypothetical protein
MQFAVCYILQSQLLLDLLASVYMVLLFWGISSIRASDTVVEVGLGSIKMSRSAVQCLVTVAVFALLMTRQSHSRPNVTDLLESCTSTAKRINPTYETCDSINISCTVSKAHNVTDYSINIIRDDGEDRLLFACAIDHSTGQNLSCVLYNTTLCDTNDEEVQGGDNSSSSNNSSEAVLIAFLVLFVVALLVAAFVILTMALMIRDMKNERVQDDLPNPYSCIFSLTKSLFAKSEKDEGEGKPQKKAEKQKNKKKPKMSESGAKHYRRREQVIYSITVLSYGKCHE